MKIKFNMQETIQREYELDELDSEKVRRRAKEIKDRSFGYPVSFYLETAIQELLRKDEICATLVDDEDNEEEITSAWIEEDSITLHLLSYFFSVSRSVDAKPKLPCINSS